MSDPKTNKKKNREKTNPKNNSKSSLKEYAKYSALGFQMLVIILAAVFGGMKLDEIITSIEFPLFTIILSAFGVVFSIYYAIKDFIRFK